jgi:hypothetical protein
MAGVQRAGGAVVVHLRMVHTCVAPLSEEPSREWQVLFRQPLDYTSVYHPNRVRIEKDRLVFESEDHDIATWLAYIDRWVASANQRLREERAEGTSGRWPVPEIARSH